MVTKLHFETMPGIAGSYVRAIKGGRAGLSVGATIPHIEASLAAIRPDSLLLRRYCELCDFVPSATLPPTYLHVLAVPLHLAMLTHATFPMPTFGLVHVAQSIKQFKPISTTAAVALSCYVEGHKPARKGVTFDLITEGHVNGELHYRGVTTVLARSKIGRGEPTTSTAALPIPGADLAPDKREVTTWHVAENLGRRYASIAKDRNPIHLHALAAKLFGFNRAIIHGMWSMAKAMATLESSWPTGPTEFYCTFKRPIFLPSSVEFMHATHDKNSTTFAVWRPGTDKLHLSGHIIPTTA